MGMKSKSSHQRCSIQKAFLENFAIFTGIQLCRTLIWTHFFLLKTVQPSCFPVNIAKFLITPFLKDTCEWLLLLTEQHDVQLLLKMHEWIIILVDFNQTRSDLLGYHEDEHQKQLRLLKGNAKVMLQCASVLSGFLDCS